MEQAIIDVREYPEFAAGHLSGSRLVPLSQLLAASTTWDRTQPMLLVCQSGKRAHIARERLAAAGFTSLQVLEGGVAAWRVAGKPLVVAASKPWSMERQVRVVAGSLVLCTMALAQVVSPWFFLATAFVGAGLVFAGVSDICMMATALGKMPWNRARPTSAI